MPKYWNCICGQVNSNHRSTCLYCTSTRDKGERKMATNVDQVLDERGSRYGEFKDHAAITQSIKDVMCCADKWHQLSHAHKEALEMIAHKIGRILNGDPNYDDSWIDIAGYAELGKRACTQPALEFGNLNEAKPGQAIPVLLDKAFSDAEEAMRNLEQDRIDRS